MLALQLNSMVKNFMGMLLREDVFDEFELRNIEISTNLYAKSETSTGINSEVSDFAQPQGSCKSDFLLQHGVTVSIDGQGEKGYAKWQTVKPLVYTIIKSGEKPQQIKIVLSYPPNEQIHPNAAALFLNLSYEKDTVTFTTATSQKQFAMDKSLDHIWDDWIKIFFANKKISVSERE